MKIIIVLFIVAILLALSSCTPEEYICHAKINMEFEDLNNTQMILNIVYSNSNTTKIYAPFPKNNSFIVETWTDNNIDVMSVMIVREVNSTNGLKNFSKSFHFYSNGSMEQYPESIGVWSYQFIILNNYSFKKDCGGK